MVITGLDQVLKNINVAVGELQKGAERGLIKAGAVVRAQGQKETPVDTGNLVNSWYGPEIIQNGSERIVAELGLTAAYAPFVHEAVGNHFQKPGAKAKFVEDPLKENESRVLKIIAEETKIT